MAINFDQLVSAFVSAVVDAQNNIRLMHLNVLRNYFDEEGIPKSTLLKIPRVSQETRKQEHIEVKVPFLTLVNPGQLAIQEMQVTMNVDINEIKAALEEKPKELEKKIDVLDKQLKPIDRENVIVISTAAGKKPGDVGTAQVTLIVTAQEIPEGLARLLDHLNKSL